MSDFEVEVTLEHSEDFVEAEFLRNAIQRVLSEEGIASARISLAVVDDAEIHKVNREFLGHDYPTDVISFLLSDSGNGTEWESGNTPESGPDQWEEETRPPGNGDHLDGELIVSAEMASRTGPLHGWSPRAELLLYVVHGLLHLCGYDDLTDDARPVMRSRERELLALWGYCPTGLET
jgi:probable rRNA maturation factor